ncbi:MAG: hypothetical protein NT049_05505 [Planctomycetota bacterium]|nr:hypothetical protein [Planctomycetota bacterium]
MMRSRHSLGILLPAFAVVLLLLAPAAVAQAAAAQPVGVVSNIKVLSDKVEDVSSPEAWKAAYIKDGMSDQEKAVAIWKTMVKYRHQTTPPKEFLQGEMDVHDPFKTIHVYGYGMCCCASSDIEGLARYAGFTARGRSIRQHSVPEIWYDSAWHLFDASLMNYFFNKDGKVASVDEIRDPIAAWHKDHPGLRFNDKALKDFGKNDGWKNGPAVLATGKFYDKDGINAAGWHGWWSNVSEYDYKPDNGKIAGPDGKVSSNVYDYGAILGYRLNVQLREGPAVLIFRMPSSYVYLGGELAFTPVLAAGGNIVVSFSDNNGLDWKELARVDKPGDQKIDLKKYVYRRYDYRVRFEIAGKGSGLDALRFTHDVQHSQAPLPLIAEGANKIAFTAGPQEGTITIEGHLDPDAVAGKQLAYTDFHPTVTGMSKKDLVVGDTGRGEAVFPVAAPGDLVRLRMGIHWRCRDPRDSLEISASFDGGRTWKPMQKLGLAQPASSAYFTFDGVPAGAKAAQVKIAGVQKNTVCIFSLRIDADYQEPCGGFRPVKVTYVWDEDGKEMKNEHICATPQDAWTVRCGPKTVAKSYAVELAR